MESSRKTVLVTGAGGFIGHHIVNEFVARGWRVFALVRRSLPDDLSSWEQVTRITGDLAQPGFAQAALRDMGLRPDVVVHAAGLASDTGPDRLYRRINYEAVTELAGLPGEKFIFISSTDVYGIKDFSGEDEDALPYETKPLSPYPRYKIMSEQWIRANLPPERYVIIRPAAVYGEGDRTIGRRVVDFLSHSPWIVHFGPWKGRNRWPAADVGNVARVSLAVAETGEFDGQAINIIDEERMTMDEFYRRVAREHLPGRTWKSVTLPFWTGRLLGAASTLLANMLGRTVPFFDPTYYAVHHIASNLDWSCERQNRALASLRRD